MILDQKLKRVLLGFLLSISLFPGCSDHSQDTEHRQKDPQQQIQPPKEIPLTNQGTPDEVFIKVLEAIQTKNWKALAESLPSESKTSFLNYHLGSFLNLLTGMQNVGIPQRWQTREISLNGVLARHGLKSWQDLSEKKLEDAIASVEDKTSLVAGTLHLYAIFCGQYLTADLSDELSGTSLKDLHIEGNRAKGTCQEEKIEFIKIQEFWYWQPRLSLLLPRAMWNFFPTF